MAVLVESLDAMEEELRKVQAKLEAVCRGGCDFMLEAFSKCRNIVRRPADIRSLDQRMLVVVSQCRWGCRTGPRTSGKCVCESLFEGIVEDGVLRCLLVVLPAPLASALCHGMGLWWGGNAEGMR
jgi:hypothetical protein